MPQNNISVGIDIGSTKVITTVGKIDDNSIDIIGVGLSPNLGMRKGVIVDIDETVSAISASLEEAERMSGLPIEKAVIGITGPHIEAEKSRGVIAVSRQDGEISKEDVSRALEAARAIPSKPNREVLHVLPRYYVVDSSETIKDPIGMVGIRLEVEANIISSSSNALKSIMRSLEQAGVQASEVIFSPLASSRLLLSKRQIEIGVMIVDIGANTTSYAVFEDGELSSCGVIPVGSMHITNDIAIGLRTNLDLAETIKTKYGYCLPDKVNEKDELDLSKIDPKEEGKAELRYISSIVEARLNEIFLMIRDNLERENCNVSLPAGIVLTGGGARIEGLVEMTKETMRLPAQLGKPAISMTGLIDKLDDPIYSTSISLMLWGKDKKIAESSLNFDIPGLNNVVKKVRSAFKNFLP